MRKQRRPSCGHHYARCVFLSRNIMNVVPRSRLCDTVCIASPKITPKKPLLLSTNLVWPATIQGFRAPLPNKVLLHGAWVQLYIPLFLKYIRMLDAHILVSTCITLNTFDQAFFLETDCSMFPHTQYGNAAVSKENYLSPLLMLTVNDDSNPRVRKNR